MVMLLSILGLFTVIYFLWQRWLLSCVFFSTDVLMLRTKGLIKKDPYEYLNNLHPPVRNLIFLIYSIANEYPIYKGLISKNDIEALLIKCNQTHQWSKFGAKAVFRILEKYDQNSIDEVNEVIVHWLAIKVLETK